jgi:hypothetical protein
MFSTTACGNAPHNTASTMPSSRLCSWTPTAYIPHAATRPATVETAMPAYSAGIPTLVTARISAG